MNVFQEYANYYNLLYREKDYDGEAAFVRELLRRNAPQTRTLLELGCGTGRHAEYFARHGDALYGIDLSADMLTIAQERAAQLPAVLAARLRFSAGDLRTIRLEQTFDAVISLFHVMSYQTTNADLVKAFATAKAHLKPGGLFLFDFWHGPAVLSEQPAVRVKRLENDEIAVVRIAEPTLKPNENVVEVHYTVFITGKANGKVKCLQETHRMRYLFLPEIQWLCADAGLELLEANEWMTGQPPSTTSWGVYVIAKQPEK